MFEVHAILIKPYKTIFNGTMNYLPRIEEEISINSDIFRVKNICYVLKNGNMNKTEVLIFLELVDRGD